MFSRLYGVLLPFFVSFLLAYVLDPIVGFIQTKCRVRNRALAVFVTLLLAVGIVVGAISALRKPVTEQVNSAWTGFHAYIATIDINDYVDKYDAVVMAFLPGTEGEGIADVLFGDYDFTGTLPITWVKDFKKVDEKHSLPESEILFPYGYGLNKTGELLIRE